MSITNQNISYFFYLVIKYDILLIYGGDIMDIGHKIKTLREKKGLSQKELAQLLNISQAAVSQFENGSSPPKITTLEKIALVLNTNIQELLGWNKTQSIQDNLSNLPDDIIFDYENAPVHLSAKQILDARWNLTFTTDEYSIEELELIRQFANLIKSSHKKAPTD